MLGKLLFQTKAFVIAVFTLCTFEFFKPFLSQFRHKRNWQMTGHATDDDLGALDVGGEETDLRVHLEVHSVYFYLKRRWKQ